MKKIDFYFPPMNKLGNIAFRKLVLNCKADYVFTEMINLDKLVNGDEPQIKKLNVLSEDLDKTIFQVMCEDIGNLEKGIKKVISLVKGKIIEINYNMGCPQSSLCKKFAGGGILKNPSRLQEISTKFARICLKNNIKPSIKTRLGTTRENITIYENLAFFEKIGITKIYLHTRTLDDGYVRPATTSEIAKCIKDFPNIQIIANGDIIGTSSFNEILKANPNGVAIGRAALENPLIFKYLKEEKEFEFKKSGVNVKTKFDLISEFLKYAKEFDISISHAKANISYLTKGCIGGNEFREKVNLAKNYDEILSVISDFS